MNKFGKELTIGAIVGGIIISIIFFGIIIYGFSSDTTPTGEAIKQGSWAILGWLVLFLILIVVLIWDG